MEEKPKISVIVGCYNVSKWLKMGRLDNIYNQTYSNWELLLIDDGSTDGTSDILDEEAKKDSRIKVIHKPNGGLGSARNTGLDNATGKYICSFDVDDEIEPDLLEYCVQQMEQKQLEVLMFGFWAITPHFGTTETVSLNETFITTQEELRNRYLDHILFVSNGNGFFSNKCYRLSFLNEHNIRFGNQYIQQDEVFNLKVYEHLQRCYVSSRVFYHYYIYNTGNNRSRYISNRFEIYKTIFNQFKHLQQLWGITDKRFDDYLNRRLFSNFNDCVLVNMFHPACNMSTAEKKKQLNAMLSDKDVVNVIAYCKPVLGIESRLYLWAYNTRSITLINAVRLLYAKLRRCVHIIKN